MTAECRAVMDLLGKPLPAALDAHAKGCAACQAVVKSYQALGKSIPTGEPLPSRIREALRKAAEEPATRPVMLGAMAVLGTAAVIGVGAVLVMGLRSTVAPEVLASVAAGWLIATGLSVWATLGWGRSRNGWLAGAWLLCAGGALLGASGAGSPLANRGCMGVELGLSVVPVALAVWLLAGRAFRPGRTFFAALAGGAGAVVALEFHCGNGSLAHVSVFHLLPWLAMAGLAVLVRSRIRSRTFAP